MTGAAVPGGAGTGTATWVYAVTGGLDARVLDGVRGVSGAPVREVRAAGLSAAASTVDAVAFSEDTLQSRLAEPDELEGLARAHHRVIAAVATAAPALPLRLGTVYTEDGRVMAMLAERQAEFTRTLDWLAGRAECGVKVRAAPGALAASPVGPAGGDRSEQSRAGQSRPGQSRDSQARAGPGSGAAYLSRRRDELAARDQAQQRAGEAAADIHDQLSELAVGACQHQPQNPQSGPAGDVMLLNGAYLVDVARLDDFAAAARASVAGRDGLSAEVTGPWPPYSFADGPEAP